MRRWIAPTILVTLLFAAACSAAYAQAPALPGNLADRQLRADSESNNWLLYGRNYQGWHYSPLTQINKNNVKNLEVAWGVGTGMHQAFEAAPIVVDGVMYVSTPWNNVMAYDAVTGRQYWRYAWEMKEHPILCCDANSRGVGIANGKVIMATLDCYVVALDSVTGKQLWSTKVDDATKGYTMTLAPQIIGNKAIVGTSGGEYGIRGHIDAYDINTGKMIWRFYTIPGPGEPGNETWSGDSWKTGGAPNWMTATYDPDLGMIYAGIGNTGPDIVGEARTGANLYADCVVALDVNTGKLRWYYQTVPHDVWDLDCTVEPVIDDITVDGQKRKVVMFAPKNGYFYVIDRTNGKPVYVLQVCHKVTWGTVTADGIPHPDPTKFPNAQGVTVWPGATGGKEWCSMAYNPKLKRMFIPLVEEPFNHKVNDDTYFPGEWFWGGVSSILPNGYGHIAAVDVEKKRIAWDARTEYPQLCSILATGSGLVVTGTPDQKLVVLDADNGNKIWEWVGQSGWHSNPISYAVKGKQYIGFPNGWGGPDQGPATPRLINVPNVNTMYVFSLPED